MKRGAFTLIELMIVISIISLISAIALPKYTGINSESKIANVKGNLANLRTAIDMYEIKKGNYPDLSGDLGDFTDFYSKSKLPSTPPYEGGTKNSTVYSKRTNVGGWLYSQSTGEIYANLADGTYSGDALYEIWQEEAASTTNSVSYDFSDENSLSNFSGNLKGWSIDDGKLLSDESWNGYAFLQNPYSEYSIETTATLTELAGGYGVFIQSDSEGGGYIFQFDKGLNTLVIRERDTDENEFNPIYLNSNGIDMNDEWWTSEHNVKIEVNQDTASSNVATIYIDGQEITDGGIEIDSSAGENYTGFRSWNGGIEVDDISISEI